MMKRQVIKRYYHDLRNEPVKKYEYDLRHIPKCRCIVRTNKSLKQIIRDISEREIDRLVNASGSVVKKKVL